MENHDARGFQAIKDEVSPWRSAHDLFLATLSIQQTCFGEKNSNLDGGFKYFFIFTPTWGNDPI